MTCGRLSLLSVVCLGANSKLGLTRCRPSWQSAPHHRRCKWIRPNNGLGTVWSTWTWSAAHN